MENLAKVFRGTLMFVGLLAIICGSFGVYKYRSMISQIDHLNEYIENYISDSSEILKNKDKIIADYKKKILDLEKLVEELKKKKDGGRWWDRLGDNEPLVSLVEQEKWWVTNKTNEEIIEYYAENQVTIEQWFEDNGERIKERFDRDGFDYRYLTIRDLVEIYINRDKL